MILWRVRDKVPDRVIGVLRKYHRCIEANQLSRAVPLLALFKALNPPLQISVHIEQQAVELGSHEPVINAFEGSEGDRYFCEPWGFRSVHLGYTNLTSAQVAIPLCLKRRVNSIHSLNQGSQNSLKLLDDLSGVGILRLRARIREANPHASLRMTGFTRRISAALPQYRRRSMVAPSQIKSNVKGSGRGRPLYASRVHVARVDSCAF